MLFIFQKFGPLVLLSGRYLFGKHISGRVLLFMTSGATEESWNTKESRDGWRDMGFPFSKRRMTVLRGEGGGGVTHQTTTKVTHDPCDGGTRKLPWGLLQGLLTRILAGVVNPKSEELYLTKPSRRPTDMRATSLPPTRVTVSRLSAAVWWGSMLRSLASPGDSREFLDC